MSASSPRHRIDAAFEAWGRAVFGRRFTVLGLTLLLVVTFASFLPQMRAENSTQSFLHTSDPASLAYEDFQRQFGQDDQVLIALEPQAVFDRGFLGRLRALHHDLESEVPHVTEVTSLVNARETRGEGDTLVVGELLEMWEEDGADLDELRRRVFANPLYVDQLISRDGRLTTITVEPAIYGATQAGDLFGGFGESEPGAQPPPPLSEAEKREFVYGLERVLERYASPDLAIHVVGGALLSVQMTDRMSRDARSYMGIAALAIALFLFLLFRRVSGVLLPMVVVAAALIGNLGTMVWMDIPFSIVLAMLPVFTMCVGVCNAVHVLVLVYRRLDAGESRCDAIAHAFGHSGLAILMTSLTTAAGMLSFVTANVAPIRNLGMTAPFGVLYAYLFTMTLLPALIAVLPIGAAPRAFAAEAFSGSGAGRSRRAPWFERLLVATGDLAASRPRAVLGVSLTITLVAGLGAAQVRIGHDPISWFPEDAPIRRAARLIDRELRGATTTEVRIDSGRENGLQDPGTLHHLEAAMGAAEGLQRGPLFVGKAVSLVDVVKETHQALNANDPSHYAIPASRRLVAQELLLFENSGSDDLEPLVDSRFSSGRLTLRVPMRDAVLYLGFLDDLEGRLAQALGPELPFTLTGQTVIQARTITALTESLARSYAFALLVITPLMIALIRDVRLGLVSMIPNLLPVLLTLGLMGALKIRLNVSTMMIGGMVIGLAVDDTIHFLHRFRREFERSRDSRAAVRAVMSTTGAALFFTSLVLATGFAVLGSLGSFSNSVHFGWLSAFGIAVAFAADVLITPALIVRITSRR